MNRMVSGFVRNAFLVSIVCLMAVPIAGADGKKALQGRHLPTGKWFQSGARNGEGVSLEFLNDNRCLARFPGGTPMEGTWATGSTKEVQVVIEVKGGEPIHLTCWMEEGSLVVEKRIRSRFVKGGSASGETATAVQKRAKCATNTGEILRLLAMYATDHDEAYPQSLSGLSNYVSDASCLRCPSSDANVGAVDNAQTWSDYILVTNLVAASQARRVLVYCNPKNHREPDGTIAGLVGGEVLWFPASAFDEMGCDIARLACISSVPAMASGADPSVDSSPASVPVSMFGETEIREKCLANLRWIDAAKEQAALEQRWTNGTVVANSDSVVNRYMSEARGGAKNVRCQANGTYKYNAIGMPPTCSVAGHILPE